MEDANLKYTASDVREVGQKVHDKWEKQMPILRECADLVGQEKPYQVIGPVVHNLSVISSENIYRLITPAFMIYMHIDLRGKSEEFKTVVKTSRSTLGKLRTQEKEGARDQKDLEPEYRQHVECDMSGFFSNFYYLVLMGYNPDDFIIHWLDEAVKECREICRIAIMRGESALSASEKMMQA